jgi:TIR domain
MPDIFISYAREDEDRVKGLVDALEQRGCSVFWDGTIPPGQTWRSHIGDALNSAKCVIVAWSRYSVNSRWVMEEADEGLKRNALIPVRLDAVDPPLGFRSIQAADLTDLARRQPSQQLNEFVNAVHHWLQNARMRPHGEAPHKASKVANADEITNATQPGTQEAKLLRSWWISPALWIGIAAVMTGVIVFAVILRNHDTPEPASTQQERIGTSDITVIFRDGSQKSLDEVVLHPGTKVCYRGVETRLAIERAGGIPLLLTDSESEEALRLGICEARAVSLSER